MSILGQSPKLVLDHYADVIEGGSAFASGAAMKGIPGEFSHDEYVDAIGTITTDAASTTTSIGWTGAGTYSDVSARFVDADLPPFFLECTSSADASSAGNVGAARKISAWGAAAVTVAAFPATPFVGDTFVLRHGFKRQRAGVGWDEEGVDAPAAFDRFFRLEMLPGTTLPWYGNGTRRQQAQLRLELRIMVRGRQRQARESVLANMQILRTVMTRGDQRDHDGAALIDILDPQESEPEVEIDETKAVASETFRLEYRITDATFI